MRKLSLAAALLLAACSTGADRAAYLNTFIGQPQTELVRQLGVPSRTYVTGGHTFLAYDEQRTSTLYGGPLYGGPFFAGGFGGGYYGGGFGYYGGGFPTEVVQRRCETTFDVANDRVLTWSFRGNACG